MARPFSAARHDALITRVVNKFGRLVTANAGDGVDYAKLAKQAEAIKGFIKSDMYGQGVAYMNKAGERLIVELPETYATLKNQQALKTAKSKQAKKAA